MATLFVCTHMAGEEIALLIRTAQLAAQIKKSDIFLLYTRDEKQPSLGRLGG